MASVTFSVSVGGDGTTVTDDANASTGLANGGHRTRFVPSLAQVVAVASNVVSNAATVSTNTTQSSADAATVAALYDLFDDRWLGAKAANPTLDNDGNALAIGAAYWNTATNQLRVWSGSSWLAQTFVPTAASSITVAADAGVDATNVQAAIEELSAVINIYEHLTFGGF